MLKKSFHFNAIFLALLCPSWAIAQTPAPAAPLSAEEKEGPTDEGNEVTPPLETSDSGPEAESSPDSPDTNSQSENERSESSQSVPAQDKVDTPVSSTKETPPYRGPATLLDGPQGELHVGGYGGISVLGTSINGTAGVLVGAEGALLLDHRFALGVAFHGLSSEVRGPTFINGDTSVLGFGYGGPVMRYQLMSPKSPVTLSVGALIGAGGLALVRRLSENDYEFDESYPANAYFVAEPSAQVHLHLTRFMRIGVSGGYRFVVGPNLGVVTDSDLKGVTAGGHLQFGWF